jgi:hypothetical protein
MGFPPAHAAGEGIFLAIAQGHGLRSVSTHEGTLLCAKGLEVNKAVRLRLRNCVCNWGLSGRVEVFIPFCGSAADRDAESESEGDGGGAWLPESVSRASAVQVMSETSW